jgi:DNA-binding response OmpR family regulator
MRVLLLEDDELFGSAVHTSLVRTGYAVDWLRKGQELGIALRSHRYDCVLLDLGLPDVSGESLLVMLRQREPDICLIVMTARGSIKDCVRMLDLGADDYMTKPVDLGELSARLRAVSRRTPTPVSAADIAYGALKLCAARHSVTWRDQPVAVTRKEYWLLEAFLRRKSQVLTRDQLAEVLCGWGEQQFASNAVEVYIHGLRRKFGSTIIQTVRGLGYQLGEHDVGQ